MLRCRGRRANDAQPEGCGTRCHRRSAACSEVPCRAILQVDSTRDKSRTRLWTEPVTLAPAAICARRRCSAAGCGDRGAGLAVINWATRNSITARSSFAAGLQAAIGVVERAQTVDQLSAWESFVPGARPFPRSPGAFRRRAAAW